MSGSVFFICLLARPYIQIEYKNLLLHEDTVFQKEFSNKFIMKLKLYLKLLKNREIFIYLYIFIPDIGLAVRGFANGPGDLGSIPGRVIPKTQKMVLDASLLNTQHYKVRIKGKVKQSREGVALSPTPWCSSYRKGSLRVTLDYGRQLYFTYILVNGVETEERWNKSY